jgi:hypothetical protein
VCSERVPATSPLGSVVRVARKTYPAIPLFFAGSPESASSLVG